MLEIFRSNQRGFTIVELLIAIVVIGILATISLAVYNGAQTRAYNATMLAGVHQAVGALEAYHAVNDTYPATGEPSGQTIDFTSVCLGSGYKNNTCGTTTIGGSACTASSSQAIASSPYFSGQLRDFMKADIPAIVSPPMQTNVSLGDCAATIVSTGPVYQAACMYTMTLQDDSPDKPLIATSGGACGKPQAYSIAYTLKGDDTKCGLNNAVDVTWFAKTLYSSLDSSFSTGGLRSCVAYGGKSF